MRAHGEPAGVGFVLHGTVDEFARRIGVEGILFRKAEPSFTDNLVLAACKYAHRGYNKKLLYSGATARQAKELCLRHLIPDAESEAEMVEEARAYWEDHDDTGKVFFVSTAGWAPGPGPTAFLIFDHGAREVRGGITKWIEGHLSLYSHTPELDDDARRELYQLATHELESLNACPSPVHLRETLCVQPSSMKVMLASTKATRVALSVFADEALVSMPACCERLVQDCLHALIPLDDKYAMVGARYSLIEDMIRRTYLSVRSTFLRRAFVSTLRARGYRILKTDYVTPYEEEERVFLSREQINMRLPLLLRTVSRYGGREDVMMDVCEGLQRLLRNESTSEDGLDRLYVRASQLGDVAAAQRMDS